jgi:hypothetical protein
MAEKGTPMWARLLEIIAGIILLVIAVYFVFNPSLGVGLVRTLLAIDQNTQRHTGDYCSSPRGVLHHLPKPRKCISHLPICARAVANRNRKNSVRRIRGRGGSATLGQNRRYSNRCDSIIDCYRSDHLAQRAW